MNHRRVLLVPVIAAAIAAAAACVAPVPPPPPPPPDAPTLEVSVVRDGLARPWDLGFLPDGSLVFTERSGAIGPRVRIACRSSPLTRRMSI